MSIRFLLGFVMGLLIGASIAMALSHSGATRGHGEEPLPGE